jgi:hypothetical protein
LGEKGFSCATWVNSHNRLKAYRKIRPDKNKEPFYFSNPIFSNVVISITDWLLGVKLIFTLSPT